jgi:Flp pilus assembly protein TadG
MKPPAIRRSLELPPRHDREAGVTILLVTAALVAIMAMAALSIDIVTLYLANAEAQRSADAAALAAARILSISGMTGDPVNAGNTWQPACATATQVAKSVGQLAQQNTVGGAAGTVTVSFPNNSDTGACTGTNPAFGVNPLVTVQVQRTDLPTFFARIWGRRGASVSATATAEAFNSSNSDLVGNAASGTVIPVQPRCVKPWMVPNSDPGFGGNPFVAITNGAIQNPGINTTGSGTGPGVVVGERFSLFADCFGGASCTTVPPDSYPRLNVSPLNPWRFNGFPAPPVNNLEYVPGAVPAHSTAVPSCGNASPYQEAVSGCDQTTVYQCGVPDGNTSDLGVNPGGGTGDTATAVQCLTHQATEGSTASGQDTLNSTVFPFQISAGSGNPLGISGQISSSNSIVSLPIYDSSGGLTFTAGTTTAVTIVGFLQVFINYVYTDGSLNVTVLNVAGCGNGSAGNIGNPVTGSSPVPVRLVIPPSPQN